LGLTEEISMKFLVYLAGPISGLNYKECTDWRKYVRKKFPPEIIGVSPMRGKWVFKGELAPDDPADEYGMKFSGTDEDDFVFTTQREVLARDHNDVLRSDAILINFLGAKTVSIGTVMEVAWAHAYRKPTVLIMEENNNLHDHAMVREVCPFVARTVDEGIERINGILLPE